MKAIIAGAREGVTYRDVYRAMLKASEQGIIPTEVICGACRWEVVPYAHAHGCAPHISDLSADMLGERWATQHGLPVAYHFADWTRGRGAGPERNARMAKAGDALVLVWDGASRGSASMRGLALAQGLPVVEQMIKGGAR